MSSDNSKTVYIKKAESYAGDEVNAAVEYILKNSSLDKLVKRSSRVLIKVNLLRKASPDEAITTHPAVAAAVIASLKKRGVKNIIIADCPSGPFSVSRMKGIYSLCGYTALEDDCVKLNYDFTSSYKSLDDNGPLRFEIVNAMLDCDALIDIAKLKTHAMTGMSGAVKNLFGVIPGLQKTEHHFNYPNRGTFCDTVCELCEIVKPTISIIDAVVGMEGDGPSAGTPRNFGFIIGGNNPFFVDRVAAHCIGLSVKDAGTVDASVRRGLAPSDIKEITVEGDTEFVESPLTDLVLPATHDTDCSEELFSGRFKNFLSRLFRNELVSKPYIMKNKCIGCGNCAAACPEKTIVIKNRKANIVRKNCIRCYCCHEVCPEKAVEIRKNFVFKVLK